MQEAYLELSDWYGSVPLQETIQDKTSGTTIDKYPLKINPIPNSCERHATVLLGNTIESIRDSGVPIKFALRKTDSKRSSIIVDAITDALISGGGGALFSSNAVLSQYLGGCVWGVTFKPNDPIQKIQAIAPEPTEFYGIPDGTNLWRLRECWFVREINASDAQSYGYYVEDPQDTNIKYYYIEHWTKDTYKISVNEKTLTMDGVPLEGANPFGIVPFVYIPHIRTSGFWGHSMITETIKGVILEMNLRYADLGDAVSDDSHGTLAVRGVRTGIKKVELPNGRIAIDIGASAGLSPNDTQPDLFAVRTDSTSAPMLTITERLEAIYRREARHPAVADGEDEGSQRSSLTLTTRMFPLVTHIKLERINWTVGMIALAEIILKICQVKGINGITEEDLKEKLIVKWAPMLPVDREALVNEVAIRSKNHLGSRRHLLDMFQDVDNVEEELKEINAEADAEAEREKDLMAAKTKATSDQSATDVEEPQAQNRDKTGEK